MSYSSQDRQQQHGKSVLSSNSGSRNSRNSSIIHGGNITSYRNNRPNWREETNRIPNRNYTNPTNMNIMSSPFGPSVEGSGAEGERRNNNFTMGSSAASSQRGMFLPPQMQMQPQNSLMMMNQMNQQQAMMMAGGFSPLNFMGMTPSSSSPTQSSGAAASAGAGKTNDIDVLEDEKKVKKKQPAKKRRKRSKDRPKRPLSAYNLFFKDERERILKKIPSGDGSTASSKTAKTEEDEKITWPGKKRPPHGKISFERLAKTIGSRWKELDDTEMDYYKKKANTDLERYASEMKAYEHRKKSSGYISKENEEDSDEDCHDDDNRKGDDKEVSEVKTVTASRKKRKIKQSTTKHTKSTDQDEQEAMGNMPMMMMMMNPAQQMQQMDNNSNNNMMMGMVNMGNMGMFPIMLFNNKNFNDASGNTNGADRQQSNQFRFMQQAQQQNFHTQQTQQQQQQQPYESRGRYHLNQDSENAHQMMQMNHSVPSGRDMINQQSEHNSTKTGYRGDYDCEVHSHHEAATLQHPYENHHHHQDPLIQGDLFDLEPQNFNQSNNSNLMPHNKKKDENQYIFEDSFRSSSDEQSFFSKSL
mmetsp:Transcript_20243/g.23448  ORF Transcript_20243/g.23448 Transcript_20243/m.23448 type:complete len:584 (+) Transcript_20243:106-1857(+)